MKKSELEKYLNKKVEIELEDGSILKGELHKTGEKQLIDNPGLYYKPNYYFCLETQSYLINSNIVFRSSYVKRLKESEE